MPIVRTPDQQSFRLNSNNRHRWPGILDLPSLLFVIGLLLTLTPAPTSAAADKQSTASQVVPKVTWHYGANPPLDTLAIFDVIVVEPGHKLDPTAHRTKTTGRSELFAYVSIGELDPGRAYEKEMPEDMLAGRNKTWNSRIIDQSHPGWPVFFVEKIISPLWQQGYRGFFLDTMDSYHLIGASPSRRAELRQGLLDAIGLMHKHFPGAKLITNRGFEVMDEIHAQFKSDLVAVAAESLFGRWDHANRKYVGVPATDRQWLTDQLRKIQNRGIPAISIDYAPPGEIETARRIAQDILALGFTPFVTNGEISQIGIGRIEIMPRKVLMLHNGSTPDGEEHYSTAQRLVKMPLHYLGYRVDLLDVRMRPLPASVLSGEYAAIVGVFEKDVDGKTDDLSRFYRRAHQENVPLVFLNGFGVDPNKVMVERLSLLKPAPELSRPLSTIAHMPAIANYEVQYIAQPGHLSVSAPAGSRKIISVEDRKTQQREVAAITPWGGFATVALASFGVPGSSGSRWIIDPIEFFRLAIERGAPIPRPDLATETGRRMLLVHIDGDGFASRAEIPGAPLAAEVMYKDFIKRYDIPHTVSIIEGETSEQGAYPTLSRPLEKIARDIFKLDHVEIASHSYSHPFFWRHVVKNEQNGIKPSKKPHLPINNYHFRLQRDVNGSIDYIDRRLAPPGKKTAVFLWTGDCVPPWEAVAATQAAGVLNMNGGDTTINRQEPTLTLVAPFSIRKNGYLQVFAPNQNENVYTNDWTGPFYGFTKVIETFEMTDRPRRLKPINIYYHTYSASKRSAITALHKVYRYALKQRTTPVYSSEYIRKVIDYEDFVIARDVQPLADGGTRWHYFGNGDLQTLRLRRTETDQINWQLSPGLTGRERGTDGDYLHLNGNAGTFVVHSGESPDQPPAMVRNANGRITYFERSGQTVRLGFAAHGDGLLELEYANHCRVRSGRSVVMPVASQRSGAGNFVHRFEFDRSQVRHEKRLSISC